ncbi:hypothetical protein FH972_008337 [Carpinus fangiana]|uniref:Secreted protein n=1 Tax=Carpinus fangiana TaxID=176857 RepID=A0A5N6QYI0_9ROSI|nr:hypothetical protein FH972_008337 [Carpinus fangiana]
MEGKSESRVCSHLGFVLVILETSLAISVNSLCAFCDGSRCGFGLVSPLPQSPTLFSKVRLRIWVLGFWRVRGFWRMKTTIDDGALAIKYHSLRFSSMGF